MSISVLRVYPSLPPPSSLLPPSLPPFLLVYLPCSLGFLWPYLAIAARLSSNSQTSCFSSNAGFIGVNPYAWLVS